MSLGLIYGPPNSGRTGALLDRFTTLADRDPVLVVPTGEDVERFERELAGRGAALLGGRVTSFPGLFELVAEACDAERGVPLTRMQRIWLARAASRSARLRLLAASARSAGFAPALERLLTDLQGGGLDAADFGEVVAGAGPYERELAALFEAYERHRDRLSRSDAHRGAARAIAALRANPDRWRERPVLLYGFDDLVREQIELIAALSAAAPVTVAFTFEDRPALAARADLLGVLRDELGGEIEQARGAEPANTASATLFHLERNLFEPDAEAVEPGEGLVLLEAAGARGEAELIGRRIAALLADGTPAGEVAVAVRSPERMAPPLARVLAGLGIPVAAEAALPLRSTATGSALLKLLAVASGEAEPAELVAYLRGPGRADPESVDWLERRLLRDRCESLEQALERWLAEGRRRIWPLEALREAGEDRAALAAAVGRIAEDLAQSPHRRAGVVPHSGEAIELRAGSEIRRALEEVAALGNDAPRLADLPELLEHVRVPMWEGPSEGRVRIASPYRLRARRVEHLFVAGLTDGSFPAAGATEPLLSDERRRALGLPARRDPASEERYLFYACVSRPQRGLALAWTASDEGGAAVARSPFVDEVRSLLLPPPSPDPADDELEAALAVRRGLGDVVPAPAEATSERDLARSLAALPEGERGTAAAALELPPGVGERALARAERAAWSCADAARPGPLRHPAVLAELGGSDVFGASTLEEYDLCSYRWFVQHELRPRRIEPDPEPLENGGLIHAALERLYRERPDGAPRPNEAGLPAWQRRGAELLAELAAERGWDSGAARCRITLARLGSVLRRYLARDAAYGGPMLPDPELLEASFGFAEEEGSHPAAELGDFLLHGRIDRIDVSADGKALIRDYKLSTKVLAAKKLLEEGKLQLPLYVLAVRGIGLEPVGGVYHPLGASKDDRPRGLLAKDERGALIPAEKEAHVGTDFLEEEQFEALLEGARERAAAIVGGIRSGRIARNPRGGECPSWCALSPICRRERGVVEPPDEEEAEL
jgi:ATP-dependent helicase/DNAse subunit B